MSLTRTDGYSLVDVLVAIVILGVASVTIYMSIAAGRAALAKSRHITWATVVGARIVAEKDLGLRVESDGKVDIPMARAGYRWKYVRSGMTGESGVTGPGVGVNRDGGNESEGVFVRGLVDPVHWRP